MSFDIRIHVQGLPREIHSQDIATPLVSADRSNSTGPSDRSTDEGVIDAKKGLVGIAGTYMKERSVE